MVEMDVKHIDMQRITSSDVFIVGTCKLLF